ncbi:MAG: hypothetical protein WBA17_11025 [Saprospiraceae bacterium]
MRTESTHSHVETTIVPAQYAAFSRVHWGAIFAGTVIGLVVLTLLNLLGIGIGLTTINPTTETNPFAGLGIGAGIWYIVSSLIALFAGGYVAGHLSGLPKKSNTGLHGLITWALFTLVSLYLFTTAVGRVVSGVGSVVSGIANTAGSAVAAAVPDNAGDLIAREFRQSDINLTEIRQEVYALLEDTDKAALDPDNLEQDANQVANAAERNAQDAARNPYQASQEVNSVLDRIRNRGEKVINAADQDALVNVLVNRTDMSEQEARQAVQGWSSQYQQAMAEINQTLDQAGEKAEEIGEDVADGIGTAAILGFIGMLLGAVAGYFGGITGTQRDLVLPTAAGTPNVNA